jgi:hypothetical protein
MAKSLTACLVAAVVFFVFVFSAESLPEAVSTNLFRSSVLIAIPLTTAYFYLQEWGRKGRTYYQPVSLIDARIDDGQISQFRLRFYNQEYAAVVGKANPELVRAGVLKVETKE